ncbi:Hypothetical protein NTJ_08995 [Nesidiocoris tenuis]|uniref:Uncharacterized protein n=1 Tax=Nesidiocoris tenuis TaxID=355587 RepID=A0ABN7AVH3_9HEMI|nr:Hypothetical protein NTJ_08995 [Nesidiocoris tenuis]
MVNMAAEESLFRGTEAEPEAEEDEISVGCPSPALRHGGSTDGDTNGHSSSAESDVNENRQDDYFKPLKRLKMMQIEQVSYSIAGKKAKRIRPPRRQSLPETEEPAGGVKSFSILDILNHRPAAATTAAKEARIVRPWDSGGLEGASPPPPLLPPPAHRGLLPPPPLLYRLPFGVGLPPPTMVGHNAARPKSAETYETCSSGRSSTGGSDCCTSPDLLNCSSSVASSPRRPHQSSSSGAHGRKGAAKDDTSPLDALFQMTSKTFEELNGESQGLFVDYP